MGLTKYFSDAEYERRWTAAHRAVADAGYEVAVVLGRAGGSHDHAGDILWLTNHYATSAGADSPLWKARSWAGVILRPGNAPELHVDEPDLRPALLGIDGATFHYDPIAGIAARLNELGVSGRVAFVGYASLPAKYYDQLRAACPDIDFVDEDDLIRALRRVKSAEELDCYREAGEICSEGLTALISGLVLGKSEAEAAADASRIVVSRGGRIQVVGVTHGENIGYLSTNPLAGYSRLVPRPGDMVGGVLHGPMHQGYYLDPGRTAVCGARPTDAQRELIEAANDIVAKLVEMIRPGVSLLEVAAEGDKLTAAFGGDDSPATKTFPFFGHGVGLFFETPRIGTDLSSAEDVFEAGMVFGVEAFLARDGVGSAAFEDNIIVGADGNELLTTTPHLWW